LHPPAPSLAIQYTPTTITAHLFCTQNPPSLSDPLSSDTRELHSFPTRRSSDLGREFVAADVKYCFEQYAKEGVQSSNFQEIEGLDRKSTRLNSSHQIMSYAVLFLKKKKKADAKASASP